MMEPRLGHKRVWSPKTMQWVDVAGSLRLCGWHLGNSSNKGCMFKGTQICVWDGACTAGCSLEDSMPYVGHSFLPL